MVPPTEDKACFAKSPLQVIVENNQQQVLLHPVFQRLIEVKWQRLGKYGAWLYFITNLLNCILWTALLCFQPTNQDHLYTDDRLILQLFFQILALCTLILWVGSEVREFWKARKKNELYKEWKISELGRDLEFAHDRWPEEREYLTREIREIQDLRSSYILDKWNYFDWLTYSTMALTVICHIVSVKQKTKAANEASRAVGSVMLIFMWLRMLKYARPFKILGLFVVMLSHVATDTVKILFLSMHFFIPYLAAFWITFGSYGIEGYTLKYGDLFYSLFQMIVVGDYNFDKLTTHAQIMSRLLVGTYIFFGGIICLNLFIALMADTFQRVYDNAKANAAMQRAATIVGLEADVTIKILRKHREWITANCSPESLYYDDDMIDPENNDLKRLTHQIKAKVDEVGDYLEGKLGQETSHRRTWTDDEQGYQNVRNVQFQNSNGGNRDAVGNETKQLLEYMADFKAEYYKSMIQTRAEIAGLGLMLKDLIEQGTTRREKRRKVKNEKLYARLGESMRSQDIQQSDNNNGQVADKKTDLNTDADADDEQDRLTYQENTENDNTSRDTHNSDNTENLQTTLNSSADSNDTDMPILQAQANQNIVNDQNSDGFFEGYTHPPQHLIASKWNSIFTKIIESKQEHRNQTQANEKISEELNIKLPALRVSPRLKKIDDVHEEEEETST